MQIAQLATDIGNILDESERLCQATPTDVNAAKDCRDRILGLIEMADAVGYSPTLAVRNLEAVKDELGDKIG